MNAWLYSVANNGNVRASWPIGETELQRFVLGEQTGTGQCEAELTELLAEIDQTVEPNATLLAKLYPLALAVAADSDAWQAVTAEYWQQGIQIILVDSLVPHGHRLFLTFTFPNEQPLVKQQLAILVERVLSGQDGCCAG